MDKEQLKYYKQKINNIKEDVQYWRNRYERLRSCGPEIMIIANFINRINSISEDVAYEYAEEIIEKLKILND